MTCGKLFATLFGWDYATMMVIGAIIVFLYTFMGGYLSVCTTDLIQGMLMFFALGTIFVGSVTAAGGVENTVAFLQSIPASFRALRSPRPFSMRRAIRSSRTAPRCSAKRALTD